MIPLVAFRLSGYVRSHRIFQPLLGLLAVLSILYATGVPAGGELPSYADSAGILMLVFAWAARGLLDNEPDEQRLIAITAVGRRRELTAGLLAALGLTSLLALTAVVFPLFVGFAETPSGADLGYGAGLHLLAVLAGTALGALTSRPVLASPAASAAVLVGGYMAILLLSSASPWASVPVLDWMNAAHHDDLPQRLAVIVASALAWSAAGLAGYAAVRRVRG
ncbi:hypothetical protein [Herbidospora cretacea]|uniref:hypothetical protein n=1 Tax=Herbidospora cretacea TaxID=28444 RepID=UPI000774DAAA|nr:hypothetical protein [Herbidospora cretacea]